MSERPSKLTTQEFIRAAEAVHRTCHGRFELGKDKQGEVRITRAGVKKNIAVIIHSKDLNQRPFVEETDVHIQLGKRPQFSLTYDAREPDVDASLSLTFEDGEVSDELVKSQTEILAKEVGGLEREAIDETFVTSVREEVDRLFEIAEDNHLLTMAHSFTQKGDPVLLQRAAFLLNGRTQVEIDYSISGSMDDPHHEMNVSVLSDEDYEESVPYHLDYSKRKLTRILRFDSIEIHLEGSMQEGEEMLTLLQSLGEDPTYPVENR